MGKAIREYDDEQQNKPGRREGGEQFDTELSREGYEENSANSEERNKQTNPDSSNDAQKGGMGSGQRQDSN